MPRPKKVVTEDTPKTPLTPEQKLAALETKISYYHEQIAKTETKRERLIARIEGRLPSHGGGRKRSPETEELAARLEAMSPEEVLELARRAQREAAFLARRAKEARAAV